MTELEISGEKSEVKPLKILSSKEQINLTKKGKIVIISLPPLNKTEPNQWQRILDDFKTRLQKIDTSWQLGTKVHLQSNDRLLDTRQISELKTIFEQVGLTLDLIITRRRQTAVAASTAGYSVRQETLTSTLIGENETEQNQDLAEPLYLKTTIRSGVEIYHPSTVVVFGDVNPGATIIAKGDVFIWGTLRGIAHAGAMGNRAALIMALRLEPTQLRIAELVARAPDNPHDHNMAEVAYISSEGIKIYSAFNFNRHHDFISAKNYWLKL
ncbi:MAG: septum site-determining protein MinC [Cyanobacteria bacterium]|nr:septum site-determining protein MinC [Cyanobacteria bacterium CG_2015-16_32_12]NCO77520.1 septum site-determining protein MinC [Cyanobacteria bacterium CG_2015-22_32_23]NCQ04200.1 septum site-determining protein MinC [Cyanobacteria bacterium CG_2015-09_32_10]NCQ41749.1 septum site-determining protein MinC [Cyanobacteria bacterium CG_2015-04_32_10]NCS84212.1 septum site-determining protein MinC [Cyanobacteria bacterium CG_2015-02_32_10]